MRGFVAVNRKTQQGKLIYVKAKAILAAQNALIEFVDSYPFLSTPSVV